MYWYIFLELDFETHAQETYLIKNQQVINEIDGKVNAKIKELTRGLTGIHKNKNQKYIGGLKDFQKGYLNVNPFVAAQFLKKEAEDTKDFVEKNIDENLIAYSNNNGFVSDNDIKSLQSSLQRTHDYITENFIQARVRKLGIKYLSTEQTEQGKQKYLNFYNKYFECPISDEEKTRLSINVVENNLLKYDFKNVYEYIFQRKISGNINYEDELAFYDYANISCEELCSRGREYFEKHEKLTSRPGAGDRINSGQTIVNKLEVIFQSDQTKKLYNKYLEWMAFSKIEDEINTKYNIAKYFNGAIIHQIFNNILMPFVENNSKYLDINAHDKKAHLEFALSMFLACCAKHEYNAEYSALQDPLGENRNRPKNNSRTEQSKESTAANTERYKPTTNNGSNTTNKKINEKQNQQNRESSKKSASFLENLSMQKILLSAFGIIFLLYIVFNFNSIFRQSRTTQNEAVTMQITAETIEEGENYIRNFINDFQKDYSLGFCSKIDRYFVSKNIEGYKRLANIIKNKAMFKQQINVVSIHKKDSNNQQGTITYRVYTKRIQYFDNIKDGKYYHDEFYDYVIRVYPNFAIVDIKEIKNPEEKTVRGNCVVTKDTTIIISPYTAQEAIGTAKRNETFKYTTKAAESTNIWVRILHPTRGLCWLKEDDVVELNSKSTSQTTKTSKSTTQTVKKSEPIEKTVSQKPAYTFDAREQKSAADKIYSFMNSCASSSRRKDRISWTLDDYVKGNSQVSQIIGDFIQNNRYSVLTDDVSFVSFDASKREAKYNVYQKVTTFSNEGDEKAKYVDWFFEITVEAYEPYKVVNWKKRLHPVELNVIAEGTMLREERLRETPSGGRLITLKQHDKVKITGERNVNDTGYYRIYDKTAGLGWIKSDSVGNIIKSGSNSKAASEPKAVQPAKKVTQPKKQSAASAKVQKTKAKPQPKAANTPKRQGPPPGM